jgi:hypothetical protein
MMFDKDGSGEVSLDEAMSLLNARFGSGPALDAALAHLFGASLGRIKGDAVLSLADFLHKVGRGVGRGVGRVVYLDIL